MTRTWRYLVLVAGLLGIGGFFAPFFEYRAPDGTLEGASAFEIARGQPDVSSLMTRAQELGMVTAEEASRATRMIEQGVYAYRGAMVACFAPAAILALLGLVAFGRRRLSRIDGVLAIVAGTAALLVYVMVFSAPAPEKTTGLLGLGVYLLAIGGALGLVGGFGALILPERRT